MQTLYPPTIYWNKNIMISNKENHSQCKKSWSVLCVGISEGEKKNLSPKCQKILLFLFWQHLLSHTPPHSHLYLTTYCTIFSSGTVWWYVGVWLWYIVVAIEGWYCKYSFGIVANRDIGTIVSSSYVRGWSFWQMAAVKGRFALYDKNRDTTRRLKFDILSMSKRLFKANN